MSGFGFYMQYLESLCRRRGWRDPMYECYQDHNGFTCLVLVNGREYQTDLAYASDLLAQENAAMRAFMVCRNFSVNGGMLARNGIVQGLPADESNRKQRRGRQASSSHTKPSPNRRSSVKHELQDMEPKDGVESPLLSMADDSKAAEREGLEDTSSDYHDI